MGDLSVLRQKRRRFGVTRVFAGFFEVVGLFECWVQSCLLTYITSVQGVWIPGSIGAWNEAGTQRRKLTSRTLGGVGVLYCDEIH